MTDPSPDAPAVQTLENARAEASERISQLRTFARRTIREAWKAGEALATVRDLSEHGDWRSWLSDEGLSKSTAHRLISLYDAYELADLATFGSVDSALRALPRPPADDAADDVPEGDEPDAKLTAAEKALIEIDAANKRAEEAEARVSELDADLADCRDVVAHFEDGERVSEGYQASRSVVEEKQAENRQLRARIARLEDKVTEFRSETLRLRGGLKKTLRERDRLRDRLQELEGDEDGGNHQQPDDDLPF